MINVVTVYLNSDSDTILQFIIEEDDMYLRHCVGLNEGHPPCVTRTISSVCTTRSQLRGLRSAVTELTTSTRFHSITKVILLARKSPDSKLWQELLSSACLKMLQLVQRV
jgi:hypothetical protein